MPESASPPTTSESADLGRAWTSVITPYALEHAQDVLALVEMLAPKFTETRIIVADGWQAYAGDPALAVAKQNIQVGREQGARLAQGLEKAVGNLGIANVTVCTVSQMRGVLSGYETLKGRSKLDDVTAERSGLRRDLKDTAALQLGSSEHREWRAHFAQLQVELALRMLRAGYHTKIGLLDDDRTIDGITAKLLCGAYPDIAPEHLDSRSIYTRPGRRLVPRKRED